MKKAILLIAITMLAFSCKTETKQAQDLAENQKPKTMETPFVWEAANLYFLLTDRFNNGDKTNDINYGRTKEIGVLRGFEGGDLKGITQKIEDGYFTNLGVNAIWMSPIVEQIHGGTDEGTGLSYGYHGYWTKDWTNIDANLGTKADLQNLVDAAHKKGIRVLLDAVINHTGPVTEKDPVWPSDWVRTGPQCDYKNYDNTVTCTLVKNLPDIKTESNEAVELPPQLVEKWKAEGRYDQEVAELDAFFKATGHPRAPRFYIMKWLSDYITDFGIDGYRVDTVKHTEAYVWQEFKSVCDNAFAEFKQQNPDKVLDDNDFYMVGEVYNFGISAGTAFDFGDKKVNYFDKAFNSLINFEFKWNAAQQSYEEQFKKYDSLLHTNLKGYGVLNYLTSHDDGQPFDKNREKTYETATRLLLSPGTSQVYYGDESARDLTIEGTIGDATLRSNMNWEELSHQQDLLIHWQKLGQFRRNHPSVGAGKHTMLSNTPYLFSRRYTKGDFKDDVIIGLDMPKGKQTITVSSVFKNGTTVKDFYSGETFTVSNGTITIVADANIILLEKINN
ncbi:alpha-amylase family glycosyl hydrolase [Olleya sp. UBA1516]|jgi:alpha-amylase|uniref:alpha-amylase family glycosyl hydrolase n=1 Tax=Olleya sp. UBA1516 TaxID=1947013 RepID=UPI0025EEE1D1|nr:alpha-amylase family glycosyl hydrolase [Olleya sp. UBA1516]|tara:strand:+ start:297421 stop:299097 length:1677 start_codon:yes stop_codon:yes gene_type:complete